MSSNPYTTTISLPDNPLFNFYGNETSIDTTIEKQDEVVVIQDINDLYHTQAFRYNFFASIGLIPNSLIFTNWPKKLFLASFFSVLLSIWISNQLILSTFIVLNIINFVTSLFADKQILFKQKLSYFINEGLLIGLISAITESLIGKISIPFTPFSISFFYLSAFFMSFYYIYEIVIRLFSVTSISKSKTFINFILSWRDVLKDWKNKFDERQEKEIITPQN